jgi:hypothetical protein
MFARVEEIDKSRGSGKRERNRRLLTPGIVGWIVRARRSQLGAEPHAAAPHIASRSRSYHCRRGSPAASDAESVPSAATAARGHAKIGMGGQQGFPCGRLAIGCHHCEPYQGTEKPMNRRLSTSFLSGQQCSVLLRPPDSIAAAHTLNSM